MEDAIKEQQARDNPRAVIPAAPEYKYYDGAMVPSGFGLINTGVICWCNSLIQLLLGLPSVNAALLDSADDLKNNIFATEYISMLRAAMNSSIQDTAVLAPVSSRILRAMIIRMRQVGKEINMGGGQECVDEAFTTFIELFNCRRVEQLFNNVYELIIICDKCKKQASSVRDTSYRIQMFTNAPLTDKESFCRYLKLHGSRHDHYKCSCGNVMNNFLRAEKLKMLREVVVIIFNKFQVKENRWFPQTLEFQARDNKPPLVYRLVGTIEHAGTMFGGHYWAKSLRDDVWHCFNDNSVTESTGDPTAGTFMIAYHLVEPTQVPAGDNTPV